MAISRFGRYEEQKQQQRLIMAVAGIVGVLLFLLIFGVKILINFSLFVDRIRGNAPTSSLSQALILPPSLDPLPEATNSAHLKLTGQGQPGLTLLVYLNETETKKLTVPTNGIFTISSLQIREGTNIISAKLTDGKGNTSDLSNVVTVLLKKAKPLLEVSSPEDNSTVTGETNTIVVRGKTEDTNSITVNDRLVVVSRDGSFSHIQSLSEGENTIKVVATDLAGNQTLIERHITYHK